MTSWLTMSADERIAAVSEMIAKRRPYYEIAAAFSTSHASIRCFCRRHGIKRVHTPIYDPRERREKSAAEGKLRRKPPLTWAALKAAMQVDDGGLDLTGRIHGDPPRGRSALDQRNG